jgi:hypothetical protein
VLALPVHCSVPLPVLSAPTAPSAPELQTGSLFELRRGDGSSGLATRARPQEAFFEWAMPPGTRPSTTVTRYCSF